MIKFIPLMVAVVAMPAAAQMAPPQAQAVEVAKKNPLDKMVCKTENTIGTRLGGHRVCATVREWQDKQQADREAFEYMQQHSQDIAPAG